MAATILYRLTWPLLFLCVTSTRPSTASGAEQVPEPYNLTVHSYNLNTTLHWDYNRTESTPYFGVEIYNKLKTTWMVIETCQNISYRFCDVSYEIIDPLMYYKFRVKALAGSKASDAATIEFTLSSVGIIGPPVLEGYIEEKTIVIDIFHPKVPSIHNKNSMLELNYIVYHGNDTEQIDDCDDTVCTATFSISDEKTYCFSAKGISNDLPGMFMEKSKEFCIYTAEENIKFPVGIIIGVAAVGFLVILAISCFVISRYTKARTLMPQSLSSVVRNMVYAHMPKPQMPRYDNVSTSPIESPVDKITYVEENMNTDTDASTDSASKESADPGYQSSLTENELKTDEREDDQFNSSNYFHTDSSSSGCNSGDTLESKKDEKIPEHAPEPPKPLTNSFGYDKPHFPK
ncbi:interferon gamma receptor 1 [Mantella aurantiaca]